MRERPANDWHRADLARAREILHRRETEHPWVTICASLVILAIGTGITYAAWWLGGVSGEVREEAGWGAWGSLGVLSYFIAGVGMIFLTTGAWWLVRGVIALRRGERVAKDGG